MKMTFRWYGSQSDKITLKQIKQIPGCTGLMGVLDYKAAGEVWDCLLYTSDAADE